MKALLVGAGGFAGSILRYLVGEAAARAFPAATLPLGTFAVNVTGCLAIGAISRLAEDHAALAGNARLFLVTGLVGGYTTFSAFGNETWDLARAGNKLAATANVAGHLVIALGAVWVGRALAAHFGR